MGPRRRGRFLSLTAKINALLVFSLALGLGAVFAVFALSLVSTRNHLTELGLLRRADILYASIENFMLSGEAPVAVNFFSELAFQNPDSRILLYRRDGRRAFSDDATINRVNSILGRPRFQLRGGPLAQPSPPPRLDEALGLPPKDLAFREDEGGRNFFRIYRPLVNLPKCTVCHGGDHTVRGLIDIRSEVTDTVREERTILASAGGGFFLVVSALALLIGFFLRRLVLEPLRAIGRVCTDVSAGHFEGRVAVRSRDEIGELAGTVNGMVRGLYERYELTKYVSTGTIGALSGGQEPRRVARTLLFSDVRGFTAYTERREAEAVVDVLNRILEAQAALIQAEGGDIDKFVGDEIVAVFQGEDAPTKACRAALAIRRRIAAAAGEFDGLAIGVGIASGSVIQGMVGSARRADFTVIGDSVNLASRLCSLAKPNQILVCAETRARASGFAFEGPFGAKIKGKAEPQRVWLLTEGAGP